MSNLTPDETLLGLLASRPQHGYELLEAFRSPAALGDVWHLSTSQLYAVLKRLEAKQLIHGQQVTVENAPARIVYHLTDTGRTLFEDWLNQAIVSASIRKIRVEFLSRLYIAQSLNRPLSPLIARQKDACQKHRLELSAHHADVANNAAMQKLTLSFVTAQLDAILAWIESVEATLSPPIL